MCRRLCLEEVTIRLLWWIDGREAPKEYQWFLSVLYIPQQVTSQWAYAILLDREDATRAFKWRDPTSQRLVVAIIS